MTSDISCDTRIVFSRSHRKFSILQFDSIDNRQNAMGAQSSSPRTVSLDNDIPVGVIDVSEDVVQRLKGLHAQGLFIY